MTDEKNESNDTGALSTTGGGISICCLPIIGQIEGHVLMPDNRKTTKYEHLIPLLVAVERDDNTDGLLLPLNTEGGDVEAGLALAELVAGMSKPTVSLVLGGGHSIGIPLAVSAKRSFIAPTATMTVHPVRMNGLVVGSPQTFWYFNRMQDRILGFVERHSKISASDLRALMMKTDEIATDTGSVLNGDEAVKVGIIDQLGGLSDALDALYKMIREKSEQ
ncbi:MAG: ATP-dependent Clp protease proteolytic subunit [Firmicutes bacterium]|nr:ATP-dependent Clp protease proteolytic subunit [Bacillota bacterium]